jgi:RNA polymerase sigma-70 factor (ECF subfamily)
MQDVIADTFQEESGRVTAMLFSHIRDLELIEDVVQDAFVLALERWQTKDDIPENPAAWILTVARRKAVDRLRRDKTLERKKAILKALIDLEKDEDTMDFDDFPDERLKLIFTCCHPALSKEARVALTLQTLGGLSTQDIAHAFLVPLATMAQRLVRAKRKIKLAGIPYQVPSLDHIPERLDGVLAVLYLIFNAGYIAPTGDGLMRRDLCREAIRLTRILQNLLVKEKTLLNDPEVMGLLALLLLHDSRSMARINQDGDLIPLEEQDRGLWKQDQIREGIALVEQALQMRQAGPYQIQASISAIHAEATTPDKTDWEQIAVLYSILYQITPSPIVELNRAVAIAMAEGYEQGLELIEALTSQLDRYYLLHAARADLLRRLEKWNDAQTAYQRAYDLCDNDTERKFLSRRLSEISPYL